MGGPDFTQEEEKLIAYVRLHDQPSRTDMLDWGFYMLVPVGLFLYGLLANERVFTFIGFALLLRQTCRLVYSQIRPSWRLGPIIEKYEQALQRTDEA